MEIWLKQGKEKLRLPVLPSNFGLTVSQLNNIVNVSSYGEVNLLGKRGLKTLPLSSLFPSKKYGFVQYTGFPKPYECVELIESWMDNPIQVTITGTNINMQATIESFNYSEQDGTGDIYYDLELKEYRNPTMRLENTLSINKSTTNIQVASVKRTTPPLKTTTYIVKAGDSLWSIAKKLTGNGSNLYAIANQNNIKNPNLIYSGQKLVIKT